MTFLNPLALFALAAAAIPILVHLFNFRRPRRIDFSSLVFLRELERSAMQRVRIRQWLLLILRTLAIACLVLAFSRPTLTGGLAGLIGSEGSGATAIVLDNSLSMTVTERQGERLRIAKDAALQVISQASVNDEIYLVTTSGVFEPSPGPLRRGSAGEAIARVNAGPQSRTLGETIARASALITDSEKPSGEIVVISDLQRSMLADTLDVETDDVDRVSLVDVGSRVPANLAVTDIDVVSRVVDIGQDVRIDATIHNYGADARPDVMASLYVDDERVAEVIADLPAGGSADVTFSVAPRSRGWLRGTVSVEDAAFDADNDRHFTLYVPERRRLLVVRGGGSTTRYVELALSPELAEGRLTFEREVIQVSALAGQSLVAYDAVMLIGIERLGSGDISLLTQYVDEGGGVLLSPGAAASTDDLNEFLARIGGGRAEGLVGRPGGDAIASIDRIEPDHPLFEGVFEGRESIRIEQADVFATLRYHPGGTAEQTLMALSNGWPFLQEIRYGDGVVFLMTSAPEPGWSELAVRGLFVPLIYRSAFYLAATEAGGQAGLTVGRDAMLTLRAPGAGQSITATLPDGTEAMPEQRSLLGSTRLTLTGELLSSPGWVDLRSRAGGLLLRRVAVNLDPRESDPALAGASEAASTLRRATGQSITPIRSSAADADFGQRYSAARRGVEIWNVFLVLALAFLVAETLVSRRWKPELVPA